LLTLSWSLEDLLKHDGITKALIEDDFAKKVKEVNIPMKMMVKNNLTSQTLEGITEDTRALLVPLGRSGYPWKKAKGNADRDTKEPAEYLVLWHGHVQYRRTKLIKSNSVRTIRDWVLEAMNAPTWAHKITWTFPDKLVRVSDNDIDDDTLDENARERRVKGDKLVVRHRAELKKFNDAFGKVLGVLGEEQVDEDVVGVVQDGFTQLFRTVREALQARQMTVYGRSEVELDDFNLAWLKFPAAPVHETEENLAIKTFIVEDLDLDPDEETPKINVKKDLRKRTKDTDPRRERE
jgi:hypothetical protein